MTNDLDRLADALRSTKPAVDVDKKAAVMAMARKKFDAAQELAAGARPIHNQTQNVSGLWTGVQNMWTKLTSRQALYATSFLCVAGLSVIVTQNTYTPQEQVTDDDIVAHMIEPKLDAPSEEDKSTDAKRNPARITISKETIARATQQRTQQPTAQAGKSREFEEVKERTLTNDNQDAVSPQVNVESATEPQAVAIATAGVEQIETDKARAQDPTKDNAIAKAHTPEENIQRAAAKAGNIKLSLAGGTDDGLPFDKTVSTNETFSDAAQNPLKITTEEPVSTFSIDVDTASYSYVRSALGNGQMPPAQSVRVEEMINYFPYDYANPTAGGAPFSTTVNVFQTPWNADTRLLHIGIQGEKPATDTRPPLNLVFLIDTSGSMNQRDKLPLLKQSFRLLLNSLRDTDSVAIVTYAGSAGTVLEPTNATERSTIMASLDQLSAGGSTAGQAGLRQAYALAESMQKDDAIGRVILATDGDFNVGIKNPEALKDFVAKKRDSGTYLSVLGFGRGNYRDDMMQTLAQNGNGVAAYIDSLSEAQKVLVDQASGALFPIANDVKIQVEFNPAQVAEYRLIGYETRALKREDFNNDTIDAGEIGAGHTITAIYEITPVGSPAVKNAPLRYGEKETQIAQDDISEYGFLKLRYKEPGQTKSKLITTPIPTTTVDPSTEAQFSAAIAGFGQLLTNDAYLGDWGWQAAIELAQEGKGPDLFGYRTEAIQLMRLAESLSR